MDHIGKFNTQTATELGLPAAIILKWAVQQTCQSAEQLEADEGYQDGPTSIGFTMQSTETFPYLGSEDIIQGMGQLVRAGYLEPRKRPDSEIQFYHVTEKALDEADRDGELNWKVYYKS